MPPVISPPARSSAHPEKDTCLLPGRLRHQLRGGAVFRPDDFEVAALPLRHRARNRRVLAALEADRAEDGLELVLRDVLAQRLAVQPDLLHRLLQYLQPGPCMAAGPAIGLLAELLRVGVEVGLGLGACLAVPRAHADHAL